MKPPVAYHAGKVGRVIICLYEIDVDDDLLIKVRINKLDNSQDFYHQVIL